VKLKERLAYVCAPLAGDIEGNKKRAHEYSRQLADMGYWPMSTHLLFDGIYDDTCKNQRKTALAACLRIIESCDFIVVFGHKITEGMALEIEAANNLGMAILYTSPYAKKAVVGIAG
jgi:hypothetical protein